MVVVFHDTYLPIFVAPDYRRLPELGGLSSFGCMKSPLKEVATKNAKPRKEAGQRRGWRSGFWPHNVITDSISMENCLGRCFMLRDRLLSTNISIGT
jgi:hypothetical protein